MPADTKEYKSIVLEDLPQDIQHDLPGAPRTAQERMLRSLNYCDKAIHDFLGPTAAEKIAAEKEAAKAESHKKFAAWWSLHGPTIAGVIVAIIGILVGIILSGH